jgi:serine/threonine-protein kinase HipA
MTHVAQVKVWGESVGAVSDTNGQIAFEYDPNWLKENQELSPIHLPNKKDVFVFGHLMRNETFQGLPGLLADALPDQFGNKIIAQHFKKSGRLFTDLSPVEKLLYMGSRSMGALEFEPATKAERTKEVDEILEVKTLMEQSRRLIQGDLDHVLTETYAELLRVGGSAGGARPKAVIVWDKEKKILRSGFVKPKRNEEHWLIKFDGTGTLENPDSSPKPYNKIEYVYGKIAKLAGINMTEIDLYQSGDYAHFMTKRFDRDGVHKHHMHSLGGMIHEDFNQPQSVSYEQYLATCQRLGLSREELKEAFRRCVFNVVAVNQDDHIKNLSFLSKQGGGWELAPAYDISYVKGVGWTRYHQMTLNGKYDGALVEEKDFEEVARKFEIEGAKDVFDEVSTAVAAWPSLAKQEGIPKDYIETIQKEHRLHLFMRRGQTPKKVSP